MPKCDRCKSDMELIESNETCEVYACLYCDILKLPAPIVPKEVIPYINHCWSCHSGIDSRICVKSSTPGMGYHCNVCGNDLKGYKGYFINTFA